MLSNEKIKQWLLKNCVNEYGDLHLSDLDFSDFDGDIFIDHWKVKGSLYQLGHEVGESLCQSNHKVGGILNQNSQTVGRNLYQENHIVKGKLCQSTQQVKGKIYVNSKEDALDAR